MLLLVMLLLECNLPEIKGGYGAGGTEKVVRTREARKASEARAMEGCES